MAMVPQERWMVDFMGNPARMDDEKLGMIIGGLYYPLCIGDDDYIS